VRERQKNRIEEQFISSQAFHRTPGERVQKITAEEQFKPRALESFNPTGFALQQFTLKLKIDTPLQTVCRTLSEHTTRTQC
jgi:hypothetical protein